MMATHEGVYPRREGGVDQKTPLSAGEGLYLLRFRPNYCDSIYMYCHPDVFVL